MLGGMIRADQPTPPQDTAGPIASHYLAFVDGLRAISIVAVVGFHVGLPGFSGGFVGVDIFFVISGFLIISHIKDELAAGRFSILVFYIRRILRILPVFLLMLLCVFVVAPVILPSPDVYRDFLLSAICAPLMVSNVLFFLRQGYFDITAGAKPLLHTWTLSVEEQFYLVTPVLLMLAFRAGGKKFGRPAAAVAIAIALVSLLGAITRTSVGERNPAFYLAHWRAWEFVAGGLVVAPVVELLRRAPRLLAEVVGCIALAAIAFAIVGYDSTMAYPSWRATVPVAGAALMILAGLAQPRIAAARLLALPPCVGVGLISYSWYLWHWPILSFIRIVRLGEPSLLIDVLGGGALAFLLAVASYLWVERPIRRWRRRAARFERPGRIVMAGVAACLATALVGGLSGVVGYEGISAYVASRYGTEGQGVLENGCRPLTASTLAAHCFEGKLAILLGDSHADALFGAFARRFDQQGLRLISIARGGCNPIVFAPSERRDNRRHECRNLLPLFEQLLARRPPISSVIIASAWGDRSLLTPANFQDLVTQFDSAHTRVLVVGPVPIFPKSSLDCVVLSDRWHGGDRERCVKPRSLVETDRAPIVDVLKSFDHRPENVRYIDPIDLFCDAATCRPFIGDTVLFRDAGHVLPSGADRIYDGFAREFRWIAGLP